VTVRVERIEDPRDPRVAVYRDLKEAEHRRHGLFIAESRTVVRRLLTSSRFRTRSLLVTDTALDSLRDVVATLASETPVYVTRPEVARAIAGFSVHRGCLAVGERGRPLSPAALIRDPGSRLVLVLEELADPDNVGGVFRNAMAFGADGVLLSPGCADPLYRKAIRVSVAGTLRVPFARVEDWQADLAALRDAGYALLALVPRGAVEIAELDVGSLPVRVALLLGNEGQGLGAGTRAAADLQVTIAMAAGVDSLNVATASGIALHRLRRRAADHGGA
jgi:tRNA G18 (ribose-2'-O)-methylase SpoU